LGQKYGILGFVEPRLNGNGIRPVSSTSRKCKAIWNILSQAGFRNQVRGWFANHPAEPIDGAYANCGRLETSLSKAINDADPSVRTLEFALADDTQSTRRDSV
jgi:uncharacterized protein YidB (DUF937 family)